MHESEAKTGRVHMLDEVTRKFESRARCMTHDLAVGTAEVEVAAQATISVADRARRQYVEVVSAT